MAGQRRDHEHAGLRARDVLFEVEKRAERSRRSCLFRNRHVALPTITVPIP